MRQWNVILALGLMVALLVPPVALGGSQPERPAGVRLLHSDQQGIELEVVPADYKLVTEMVNGVACERIHLPGSPQSTRVGWPQLPVLMALLGVPPGVELEVEVTPLQSGPLPLRAPLCPAPEAVTETDGDLAHRVTRPAAPDAAVYGRDAAYPAKVGRVEDVGYLRSQRIARLEISPFQVNPVRKEMQVHSRLHVSVRFRGAPGAMASIEEPAGFESALQATLLNYKGARDWRAAETPSPSVPAATPWTPPRPAFKVQVDQDGIYEISTAALAGAGVPVGSLDPRTLRLLNQGEEVAILVNGEKDGRLDGGDSLLFYGQAADTRYTGTNVYWLTYGAAPGLRMGERSAGAGGTLQDSYAATVHLEKNRIYVSSVPMESGFDHWYDHPPVQAPSALNPRAYTFTLDRLAAGGHTATLEAMLAGNFDGGHHVRLYVNGHLVHDGAWQGRTLYQASASLPQSYLLVGENLVEIELVNDLPGQAYDSVYVDWLRVTYQRAHVAQNDVLAFDGKAGGPWQYDVSGFDGHEIELYDVTDPTSVQILTGTEVTGSGYVVYVPLVLARRRHMAAAQIPASRAPEARVESAGAFTLHFGDSQQGPRQYVALTSDRRLAPLGIEKDSPSDLQAASNQADYLIVTHKDFEPALQMLIMLRQARGLRVKVVDVQDAYDEFGYGLMSSEAIRDFVAHAYHHWQGPAPGYLLLVGDGTYDFRHYLTNTAPTYLPPYLEMVDRSLGEAAADNRYGCVSGDDILPDLDIGRLPANTLAEAQAMVDKIMAYEFTPAPGDWNRNVLFVADDRQGGGGDFAGLSDSLADGYADPPTNTVKFLPPPYQAAKVYLEETCPYEDPSEVCRQQILDQINIDGALLVSYIGHSAKTNWAHELLMDLAALSELENEGKLPIALGMTCLEGYFHQPETGFESLAEANVRKAEGGMAASWSATGLGLASGHDYLEQGLFLALFQKDVQELGPATTLGKLFLVANTPAGAYDDLVDTYVLFGDPGLHVHLAGP